MLGITRLMKSETGRRIKERQHYVFYAQQNMCLCSIHTNIINEALLAVYMTIDVIMCAFTKTHKHAK